MTSRYDQSVTDATFDIIPATVERWSDVAELLGGSGAIGCWCQPWRGTDAEGRARGETRPDTLRRHLADDDPPPGFLAYLDGMAVGWAGVATRATAPRLMRSGTIPAVDDLPVWSIGCFRVRAGLRRRGVSTALLAGVVDAARRAGAPGVEAYPIDPAGRRVEVAAAFVGIASTFDAAGFQRVGVTTAQSAGLPRLIVRLIFDD